MKGARDSVYTTNATHTLTHENPREDGLNETAHGTRWDNHIAQVKAIRRQEEENQQERTQHNNHTHNHPPTN